MDEYPMDSKFYQIGEEIGIGTRSVVHKAHCISNNSEVAIKIIDFHKSVEDMERVAKKAKNMAALATHPNILKHHCAFTVADSLWVVMPFASGASLQSIMANRAPERGDLYLAIAVLKGICSALCHLHRRGQMHGDVKPGNILLDSDGTVKLGDLGFSASVCGSNDLMELETPLYWVAPEMLYSCGSIRSDIWSFGITALELAHCAPPLSYIPPCDSLIKKTNRRFGLVDRFGTQNVGGLFSRMKELKLSGHFKNMVAWCLNQDELSRPSAKELMEHHFFKENCKESEYLTKRIVQNRQNSETWDNNNVKLGIVGWELDEETFELNMEQVEKKEVKLLQMVLRKNMELQKMKRELEISSENRRSLKKMKKLEETKSTEEDEDGVGEEE